MSKSVNINYKILFQTMLAVNAQYCTTNKLGMPEQTKYTSI